ncbi:hypothetical protein [Intestinibacillus massiliensis]|uniref:hypothetical protein n=1 Tax=Intestinibacillus massiliensis TaxID=1871029 RepID=UPI000B351944|nr:hypothetical protein [Intestinibacillus massiliensis]
MNFLSKDGLTYFWRKIKSALDSKETPDGAQQKADQAKQAAITEVNTKYAQISMSPQEYRTLPNIGRQEQGMVVAYDWVGVADNGKALAALCGRYALIPDDGSMITDTTGRDAAYSTDGGLSWTRTQLPSDRYWSKLGVHKTSFIALADGAEVYAVSEDNGVTWTEKPFPCKGYWSDLAYDSQCMVATSMGGTDVSGNIIPAAMVSMGVEDTWNVSQINGLVNPSYAGVAIDNGVVYVLAKQGDVQSCVLYYGYFSDTGVTNFNPVWPSPPVGFSMETKVATNGMSIILLDGNNRGKVTRGTKSTGATSFNTWETIDIPNTHFIYDVANNGKGYLLLHGNPGYVKYSADDGVTWDELSISVMPTSGTITPYGNGFYAITGSGKTALFKPLLNISGNPVDAGAVGVDWIATQSDWEMNDESNPAFIKNRPFFTDTPQSVVKYSNPSLSFVATEGNEQVFAATGSVENTFITGETYLVLFDGDAYFCIAKTVEGKIAIGNMHIVHTGFEDTKEPFLFIIVEDMFQIGTTLTGATHSITISHYSVDIHKIDLKYLPIRSDVQVEDGVMVIPTFAGRQVKGSQYAEVFNLYEDYLAYHKNEASGFCSHAEGCETDAIGDYSHAEGNGTTASGAHSHAEGLSTTASGSGSHAEGFDTTASGKYSHAEGNGTIASGDSQHVQGKFNLEDTEKKYAHIVGAGDYSGSRANIHTLDWKGNAWFSGTVCADGTPMTPHDLVPKEYLELHAIPKMFTILLPAAGWVDNAQTVTVSGVLADESKQLILPMAASASRVGYNDAGVQCIGQAADSLTFQCNTVPADDLTVYVTVQEVL